MAKRMEQNIEVNEELEFTTDKNGTEYVYNKNWLKRIVEAAVNAWKRTGEPDILEVSEDIKNAQGAEELSSEQREWLEKGLDSEQLFSTEEPKQRKTETPVKPVSQKITDVPSRGEGGRER